MIPFLISGTHGPLQRNPDWDDEFNAEEDAFLKKSRSEMEIANYLTHRKQKRTARNAPTTSSGQGSCIGSHDAAPTTSSSGVSESTTSVEDPHTLQGTNVIFVDEHGTVIETTLVGDMWFPLQPSPAKSNAPPEAVAQHEVQDPPKNQSSHDDLSQELQERNAQSTAKGSHIEDPQPQVTPQEQPDPTPTPPKEQSPRKEAETSPTIKAASTLHKEPRTTPQKPPPTPYIRKEHVTKDLSRRKVIPLRPCKAPNVLLGTTPPTQPAMSRVSSILSGSTDGGPVSLATRIARQKKKAAAENALATIKRNLRSRKNGDAPGV